MSYDVLIEKKVKEEYTTIEPYTVLEEVQEPYQVLEEYRVWEEYPDYRDKYYPEGWSGAGYYITKYRWVTKFGTVTKEVTEYKEVTKTRWVTRPVVEIETRRVSILRYLLR